MQQLLSLRYSCSCYGNCRMLCAYRAGGDFVEKMCIRDRLELVENYKLAEAGGYILFCVAEDSEGVVNAFSSAAEQ